MTDCFIGGSGKDYSWCMVSDCPFVVRDKQEIKFIGVKTMEEAAKYHEIRCPLRRICVGVWTLGEGGFHMCRMENPSLQWGLSHLKNRNQIRTLPSPWCV